MGGYIGATGQDEVQEQFDILKDEIDANASYINTLVGIPDPTHLPFFGVNILNPGLYGLVERAEVNIKALQTQQGTSSTAISGIETAITGIETSITGIEGQITAVEGSISTIQFVELPLLSGAIGTAAGVAADALVKANKSLGIWDESGNNVYHKKSGNVGIGITFADTLNNKLEVNGNINIPLSSNYKIGNQPLNYSHLAGTPPVSSKWTNATDTSTNIFYNTGNVGIGTISGIINRLEVGGNINIPLSSNYKINNQPLNYSHLAGTLSYNSLTDKLTQGTNITITGNVINNTYSLPTAGVGTGGTLGGVKVDGTTITITNQVISAVAGAQQVNSDWTQTNTSLKSFIQNKPTAGANISFANNQISLTDFVGIGTTPPSGNTKLDVNGNINSTGLRINNLAIGSDPTQNIINLSGNKLLINDKPDTERIAETFTPHTSLSEPSITSPTFTESIRTFVHSGGTENQTSYNITIGQNTICDILIVGGGGGGGKRHGGGGGAGTLLYHKNIILNGTYNIKVGKGGAGHPSSGSVPTSTAFDGSFSQFVKSDGTQNYYAVGGGRGTTGGDHYANTNGGQGYLYNANLTLSSGNIFNGVPVAVSNKEYVNTLTSPEGCRGRIGGTQINNFKGGGGGGAGGVGMNHAEETTVNDGYGGLGLAIDITGTSVVYAGGGGGSDFNGSVSQVFDPSYSTIQLRGGGGYGSDTGTAQNGLDGTGGGGGGQGNDTNGNPAGKGGSGIVIIKFKTIVGAGIPEYNSGSLTHKTLNFVYDPTKYAEYLAQQKTGVGGWRIVRFLPPDLNRWYVGNYINTTTINVPTIGTPYNYTNEWAVPFGTFDEMFFGTFDMTHWLQCPKSSVLGVYSYTERYIIKSSAKNYSYTAKWWNRNPNGGEDPWISINDMDTDGLIVYGENSFVGNQFIRSTFGGMCVLVRDSTASALVPQPNTYNLSVSSDTSISINSGTFQYLSGNYTISVGATQSSVVIAGGISQAGQTDPYPLQNGSTITIRYYMLRRTISLDYYKKSGFIKYVPSLIGGEFPDTGSWQIVDIDNQALGEFAGSITFDKVMGNLPLDKLPNIDMSKITTGNLDWSRISSQPALSSLSGNLPANKLDNLDMSKITTGQLDYTRLNGQDVLVNNRFLRIVEPYEAPTINTSGVWTSKYRVFTNLHLNHYGAQYNYYRYYASISSNRNDGWGDRHKFWFGVVKFSHKVNTDGVDGFTNNTAAYNMYTNATGYCVINPTSSSDGVWWLNFTLTTAERTDQAIVILH